MNTQDLVWLVFLAAASLLVGYGIGVRRKKKN